LAIAQVIRRFGATLFHFREERIDEINNRGIGVNIT
jgi:hypothetical protein